MHWVYFVPGAERGDAALICAVLPLQAQAFINLM